MKTISRMTAAELSLVLNITEETVIALAKTEQIPSFRLKNRIFFDFMKILEYFRQLEGKEV